MHTKQKKLSYIISGRLLKLYSCSVGVNIDMPKKCMLENWFHTFLICFVLSSHALLSTKYSELGRLKDIFLNKEDSFVTITKVACFHGHKYTWALPLLVMI